MFNDHHMWAWVSEECPSIASPAGRTDRARWHDSPAASGTGIKVLWVLYVRDKVPTVPDMVVNEVLGIAEKFADGWLQHPWSYAHVSVELAPGHTASSFLNLRTTYFFAEVVFGLGQPQLARKFAHHVYFWVSGVSYCTAKGRSLHATPDFPRVQSLLLVPQGAGSRQDSTCTDKRLCSSVPRAWKYEMFFTFFFIWTYLGPIPGERRRPTIPPKMMAWVSNTTTKLPGSHRKNDND
ncbi:hypothetical protein EJ110_NYTH54390 [Nymphaea thermarum]|nr:hypothetical protein EJ110_NYTH54390 [Nymphaea thermarum]